ncbi:glycoside hydrolase family protein [Pseudoalteromonas rhizosphaerae]|uniref:glycoside hydrolase family protein n=1 Tax=Pseudoalteromonas rhizosphaerae TaxID=2518973 RepID=UPI0012312A22|nr:glycoside hydrolase family protein [Pseudoalteromonas rhizosphaerae]
MMNLIDQLKRHAGFYECIWYAPRGRQLIGYGHDLSTNRLPEHLQRDFDVEPITEDEAEHLLAADLMTLREQLIPLFDLDKFNYVRQQAILSVAYWITFPCFCREHALIKALRQQEFEAAAVIVGTYPPEFRAIELAGQLLTGEYQ